ncbi:hypothetical protein [Streptomyces echinatus]|uniref:hypothetical protein n=1 Tax=Streptomyces echinatus TaxID=67293 RepID=UPI003CD05424
MTTAEPPGGLGRRRFLRGAALAGAGLTTKRRRARRARLRGPAAAATAVAPFHGIHQASVIAAPAPHLRPRRPRRDRHKPRRTHRPAAHAHRPGPRR